jgi:pimeloyl-ACP methyl ester carboxylesterase
LTNFAIISSNYVGTTIDFHKQMRGFDATKFTLVAWDPPGYGRSRPPDRKQGPTATQKDAKIAAELMKVGICSVLKNT